MKPFEPDGMYSSILYRVLPDSSIEAMLPGGLVKFKDMDQFLASVSGQANANISHVIAPYDVLGKTDNPVGGFPTLGGRADYYSILLKTIESTKQNSAQLRALVYERARFNLKRDVLFGNSSMGLADLVRQIEEFELAVARVEASADDDHHRVARLEPIKPADTERAVSSNAIQILPPRPIAPLQQVTGSFQWRESFQQARWSEEVVRYLRSANRSIGFAALGIALVGMLVVAVTLWPSRKIPAAVEIANKAPPPTEPTVKHNGPNEASVTPEESLPKLPFPLPTSFGIYVLSDNKLTELVALPINVPDPRVELSAEIKKLSNTTIADTKPAFILFRRDLLNSAPQKVELRIIARMARQTKIVDGKATVTNIEGIWRIRNITRELKISPIAGQREMVIARLDDDVSLAAGRYVLVLNRVGFDFSVSGPAQSPVFCLEGFEAANGSVFNQCRTP